MKPAHNPKQEKGDRNVYCPYYGDCLDYAIEASWQVWNCVDCHERANQAAMPDFQFRSSDTIDYLEIPMELYNDV